MSSRAPAQKRPGVLFGGALVALVLLAYLPALRGDFLWDDDRYVSENPHVRSPAGLRAIWLKPGATDQYYPLVFTSFWLEYRLWGLNPIGYHLVNVALHVAGALLIWRILRRLAVPGAALAAAVFALHPVHVESVAWITERKNVLSLVFYLAALRAYLAFIDRGDETQTPADARRHRPRSPGADLPEYRSGAGAYFAALACFACALLSKTVTASLPAAVLIILWWKRGRLHWADLPPLLPFFALGLTGGLITALLERHHVGAAGAEWDFSAAERCIIAGRAVWFYLGKLIWPVKLAFIYPRWQIDAGDWRQYIFPAGALFLVLFLWLARDRLSRGPLAAALYFGGTLLPALGFLNVYPMRFSFVADHFQYLASIGPIVLLGAACATLGQGQVRWLAPCILIPLGVLTFRQARIYQGPEALWRDTLARNPDAWLAHNNLGILLSQSHQRAEAIAHFQAAIRLNPGFFEAHYNLANRLRDDGRSDEAIRHYQACIGLRPDFVNAHYNLGHLLESLGRLDEAAAHFRAVIRFTPADFDAHYKLGDVAGAQRRFQEAVVHYSEALRLRPDNPHVHCALANALTEAGQPEKALSHYRQALRIRPGHAEARRRLDELSQTVPAQPTSRPRP